MHRGPKESFGLRNSNDRRPRGQASLWREGVCIRVVSEKNTDLTYVGRKISANTILPRKCIDPPVANRVMEREMRELRARLDSMETTQRRAPDVGDVSEAEMEEVEFAEAAVEDATEERVLRAVVKSGARAKIDIPMYEGNLNIKELLD